MPLNTGTHDISRLLEVERGTVQEFGLDEATEILQADLAAHNRIVGDLIADLAEESPERTGADGVESDGEMVEADEYTRAPTQVMQPPVPLDFPLRRKQFAVGWTADWFQRATPADLARRQIAAEKAHMKAISKDLRNALFGPANYTVRDYLVDFRDLNVKRLANGDGSAVRPGPNGEMFDGATHTHYDANGAPTNATVNALLTDVIEHGHDADLRLYINRGQEAFIRGLADFHPFVDARLRVGANNTIAVGDLDVTGTGSGAIGVFGPAEVRVKSWVPNNYLLAFAAGDARKPLRMRVPVQEALRGLRIVGQNPTFPLIAEFMAAEFGFGVRTRTNGAVLFVGGAGYVSPTI